MKTFIIIFSFWPFLVLSHAADYGKRVSGEMTINDLAQVALAGQTYLDFHGVVIKRPKLGGGIAERGTRSNIIDRVVTQIEKLLRANLSIQIVNLFDMHVHDRMRIGGFRFGKSEIAKDVLDVLKNLFPSVLFKNEEKIEFVNLGKFGKKVPLSIRSFILSKGEYCPSDLSKLQKLKDLKEVRRGPKKEDHRDRIKVLVKR